MILDTVRTAKTLDVGDIAQIVNSAYRPRSGAYGWTHEADLIAGARISAGQIAGILSKPDSVVLLGLIRSETAACVHIERVGGDSHIGMLAVTPSRQDSGIGKELLAHAEHYAHKMFLTHRFVMMVVSSRSELISFYERRGYQRTGSVMSYPRSAGVGIPLEADLKIEMLEKWAGGCQVSTAISRQKIVLRT